MNKFTIDLDEKFKEWVYKQDCDMMGIGYSKTDMGESFKAGAELMRKLLADTVLKQDEALECRDGCSNVCNVCMTVVSDTRQQLSAVVEYLREEGDK